MDLELEIFRNLFVSIAEQMGLTLKRSAFSPNIKERQDYSCALYDAEGRTVAMGDHMPVHLGAMPFAVEQAVRERPPGPGDVVLLNDPFRGGTHLPDLTTVSGVFLAGDRPDFYLASRAHHSDVGGMTPGSMPLASEIFQEGLRIPPVRLVRGGEIDEDLLAVLLANTRTPEERRGDLDAQLGAHRIGEAALRAAAEKYGAEKLASRMSDLMDYAERLMRARIGELPDGVYRSEDFLDDDGFADKQIRISASVTIGGDRAVVDFSESAPQSTGGVNANRAVTVSATMYVFRCLIEEDVPYNAGLLRPVEIVTKPGTVADAQFPASVAAGNVETSQRLTDVLLGALAQALPEGIPAASSGSMNNVTLGSDGGFAYYETIAGGMGASPAGPGMSAVHTHMTNSLNTPTEALERQAPVRVNEYRLRKGSGGAGEHRGGDGVVREFEFLEDGQATLLTERRERGPYGLSGGEAGAPGKNTLDGEPLPAKGTVRIRRGQRLRIETPGGGGWGQPDEESKKA